MTTDWADEPTMVLPRETTLEMMRADPLRKLTARAAALTSAPLPPSTAEYPAFTDADLTL